MPDLWTHLIGGDMVINELDDKALCDVILDNRSYFNMGTQGPDFFFYNDFWPWIKEKKGPSFGTLIHSKNTKDFLLLTFKKLKEKEGSIDYPQSLSYFMGFITHLLLDNIIHKIIDEITTDDYEHKRLEIELDCYFTKKYLNSDCHKLNPLQYIKLGENFDESISKIIYSNIKEIYNLDIDYNLINKSYRDMLKVHSILYSPLKMKAFFLNLFTNFFSINLDQYLYANVNKYIVLSNKDINNIENKLSVFITQSINIIDIFCSYLKERIDINEVEEKINYYFVVG